MYIMTKIKTIIERCAKMTDQELWDAMPRMLKSERHDLAEFLIHLAEINTRDLHLRRAYSGLFVYLRKLGVSEWESRARSIAAVQGKRFPRIYSMLRVGRLNLTSLAIVGPHLTSENYRSLLGKASKRSRRELEALVAELSPRAGRRDTVRVVSVGPAAQPAPLAAGPLFDVPSPALALGLEAADLFSAVVSHSNGPAITVEPQVKRLRYTFDADETLDEMLGKARGLLWHKYPYGEMEYVLRDALDALLEVIDPERKLLRRQKRAQASARDEFRGPTED
jgi:hypothetical protein